MGEATVRHRVGQSIAAARRAAGMTHADLAARLGWPRDTLIHFEYGRRSLSIDRLTAIASALDCEPATLLIADTALAHIVERLARDASLLQQVAFFLQSLEDEHLNQSGSYPEP